MKIVLEYVAMLRVEGATNGAEIEVPEHATVADLLTQLGIRPEHQRVIVPFIGNERVNRTAGLHEGDRVFLSMPVGGGCPDGKGSRVEHPLRSRRQR